MGTKGYGGIVSRSIIMGVVGGTASALGGGKFSNGAMTGAFTHLFNAEGASLMKNSLSKEAIMAKSRNIRAEYNKKRLASISDYMNTHHAGDGSDMQMFWGIVSLPLVAPRLLLFGTTAVISYPIETIIGIGVVESAYGGTQPVNGSGSVGYLLNEAGVLP